MMFFDLKIDGQRRSNPIVVKRNQLWILLAFFGVVGLFSGFALWQISQSQQKDRDLARARNELEQTTQQMDILKEQNTVSMTNRGKLQKDLTAARKQLTTFQSKGLELEQQLKVAKAENARLGAENSALKIRVAELEKQNASLQQNLLKLLPGQKATSSSTTSPTSPPGLLKP